MGWKDWSIWVRFGLIFSLINIILSLIALSVNDIRNPTEGFGDLKALAFPNILFGIPTFLLHNAINRYITLPLMGYKPGTIYELDNVKVYHINNFINLFIVLTLYWFLIGGIIGKIYFKIKSKRENK